MRKNTKKEILSIAILGIIILLMFSYSSYKIEKETTYPVAANVCNVVVVTVCILVLFLCIYFYSEKELKPEKAFLVLVPLCCILLTVAMPMSKGHDETVHGLRIYEYAEGKWNSNGKTAYLEEGVINALEDKPGYMNIFDYGKTYDTNTNKIDWGYRVATYSPITYLPQVVAIQIARCFTSNSMIHLYMARLANIVVCMILFYITIKIIPFGKNLIFLLSFIPIAIEGFSTLSADGITIAICFLWIAYILKLRQEKDKKLGKKEFVFLSILTVIISLSKTIYIVVLPLLFLLPKEKFKNKNTKLGFILITCLLGGILDIAWYILGVEKETLLVEAGNDPIGYLCSNPIGYFQKLCYTILTNAGKYLEEIFGGKLEWDEVITIPLFPILLCGTSILVSSMGKVEISWKKWEKLLIMGILLAGIFLVFTAMFISWSDTEADIIQGIQGRYFLPLIPLVFLLFGRRFLEDSKTTRIIAILGSMMQIFVVLELVLYHI